ncbi:HNH endonuclease [Paenarthrobacter sp. NEAU-H11]|uniref:HNH endonuclease n=1 Tax=Paenarthrobacter sp. NEAU-H11 TaxID=3423924 RepID=UPI003D32A974
MAAVLLGWNPNAWDRWDYRAAVEQVEQSGRFLQRWSIGLALHVRPGAEAWLLVEGSTDAGSGLIGHGVVVSEPYATMPRGEREDAGWHVSVAFDALLPLGEQIPPEAISHAVPGMAWRDITFRSGMDLPPGAEPGLRRLWREQGPSAVVPAQVVSGTYPQAAVSSMEVNRYERDPEARRMCLAFHGTSCAACGFSFEASYGDTGTGYIDVHHVVPPEMLGAGYQLDPIVDLVPLCPNCHALAHHGVTEPRTVSELRNIIAAAGHLRGEAVSPRALQAQDDARRILEGRQD